MALTKSGELLKSTRLKKGFTLEEVEKTTKIRVKFLRALEEGELSPFHSTPYARGFLKNYAEFLGIDSRIILALFRRETSTQNVSVIPKGMMQDGSSWFRITPTRGVIVIVFLLLVAIGYYLLEEYRGFLGAPALFLDEPKEQTVVREGEIEVLGRADRDTTVFVNSEAVALKENGRFLKKVRVFKGETTITILAKNRRGKETIITRKIIVE